MIKKIILSVLASFILPMAIYGETVNNATIINMLKRGFSTDVIKNYIEEAEEVELSSDLKALDELLQAGAEEDLIVYVQNKVKQLNAPSVGLYWQNTGGKPQKLEILPLEQQEGNIGKKLLGKVTGTAGNVWNKITGKESGNSIEFIAPETLSEDGFKSNTLILSGAHSPVIVTESNPVFRFIRAGKNDEVIGEAVDWYGNWIADVKTPAEFQVIKLTPKGKEEKAYREFPSSLNWSSAGFTTTKKKEKANLIDFKVKKVKDNIYDVVFDKPLEPGEYVFFYKNTREKSYKGLVGLSFTVE